MVDAATQAVDAVVTTGPDDAEEAAGGAMSLTPTSSSSRSRTDGNQIVGIRFVSLGIPQGATITQAWIQFAVDERARRQRP